jgi:hypothetical protein
LIENNVSYYAQDVTWKILLSRLNGVGSFGGASTIQRLTSGSFMIEISSAKCG